MRDVERVPLSSSVVVAAAYDELDGVLEIEFASGRIYQYEHVPQGTFDWLLKTPHKGAYVARMINGRYPHREVTPAPEATSEDLAEVLRRSLERVQGPADPER